MKKSNILNALIIFCFICINVSNLSGQIPTTGTFNYKLSLENPNEPPNPYLAAMNEVQHVVFYNDSMIVSLQSSVFTDQSYIYTNRNNGECTIIEKEGGTYVMTNTKDFSKAFDFLELLNTKDTITYDTLLFEYLGDRCKKVIRKYDSNNSPHFIINDKISFFSKSENKQIYLPLAEYSKVGEFSYSKKVLRIEPVFDHSIFKIDTIGLKRLDLETYVNTKLGFQIGSDTNSEMDAQPSKSKTYRYDDITTDTFYYINQKAMVYLQDTNITSISMPRKMNYEVFLDSLKNTKLVTSELMLEIEQKINTVWIDEILRKYFFNKTLSYELGRKILLENLEFAGIRLWDDKSPLTSEKYQKEGYALDQLISELKGYHRLVVNLEDTALKDIIFEMFKIVFPEYSLDMNNINVAKDYIYIRFRENNYRLSLEAINSNTDSKLHYTNSFIVSQMQELFSKIFVDLDLKRKIGICSFSQMKSLYSTNHTIDTLMICVYDKSLGLTNVNLSIGLSFHDSLNITNQLKLIHLYGEPNLGQIKWAVNYNENSYLKTNELKEFQKFYRKVGQNNKYIKKMMFEAAENIPYELTDLDRVFNFFFDFYLDEYNFSPIIFKNNYEGKKCLDTICYFNTAFPKIYDLLNRKLEIEKINLKKINDVQYVVQFNFSGKEYKSSGTYEDISFGCSKIIDQILASDKKYKYRIYTSLDGNEFYKNLIILKDDEVPYFEKASKVKLTTHTK